MRRRAALYLLYPFIAAFYVATGQRKFLHAFKYLLTTKVEPVPPVREPRRVVALPLEVRR